MAGELVRVEAVDAIPELNLAGWEITHAAIEYPHDPEDRIKLCADLRPISPDAVNAAKAAPSLTALVLSHIGSTVKASK